MRDTRWRAERLTCAPPTSRITMAEAAAPAHDVRCGQYNRRRRARSPSPACVSAHGSQRVHATGLRLVKGDTMTDDRPALTATEEDLPMLVAAEDDLRAGASALMSAWAPGE